MRILIVLFIASFLILSACSAPQIEPATNMPGPDEPVSSDGETQGAEPPVVSWEPRAEDADWQHGEVFLDVRDILVLESYPPQYRLNLTGSLPNACHELRIDIAEPDKENFIRVKIYSVINPELTCTKALQPFNVSVPLDQDEPGIYTVIVNGDVLNQFEVIDADVLIDPPTDAQP